MNKPFIPPSIARINKRSSLSSYRAISFFAGCGGSSVGYKLAGFKVLYANEFIEIAAKTYKVNAPSTLVDTRDIRKIDPLKLMAKLGLKRGQLELLDGSPPCSAFSTAGTRDKGWNTVKKYSETKQRVDDLFEEYFRMVEGFMPKVAVAENVPGLAMGKATGYMLYIIERFQKLGYIVDARIVDAALLGLPQHRRRLIFIAVRKDIARKLQIKVPPYPKPKPYLVTVKDVLPNIERIRIAASAGKTTFKPADRPSPTITASDSTTSLTGIFSCGGWVDDTSGERRKYTIDELRLLFGFPKDFKLLGKFEQQWERLGRSHSPCSTYHIGKTLIESIFSKL